MGGIDVWESSFNLREGVVKKFSVLGLVHLAVVVCEPSENDPDLPIELAFLVEDLTGMVSDRRWNLCEL